MIEYYEFHKDLIPCAVKAALGYSSPAVLERVPSWLREGESGAAFGRMPAMWSLLPVGLAVPFLF